MPTVSLDKEQLRLMKKQAVRERNYADRISVAFAFRLLGITSDSLDVFSVLDELDYLEGIASASKTKAERAFKHPPLIPFWHKHFASARHVASNIMIRWNMGGGGNRDLAKLIENVAAKYGDYEQEWPAQLAHALTVGAIEERQERGLTGDWIIYGKHEGKNHYLDLATHNEGTLENSTNLYEKLKSGCAAEFPFLFQLAVSDRADP